MLVLASFLLPGTGLIWQGRTLLGCLLLALAMLGALVVVVSTLIFTGDIRLIGVQSGAIVFAACAFLSGVCYLFMMRSSTLDEDHLQELSRQTYRAHILGHTAEAVNQARIICKHRRQDQDAWELLVLCAESAGEQALVKRAKRRIRSIRNQLS